jgi:copper chaperone NosL
MLACAAPAPRPIVYGTDQCAHCHMTVADPRYAAELVTSTGKVIVFDDIGCLGAYLASGSVAPGAAALDLGARLSRPAEWVPARDLSFVRSESFHTPMGQRPRGLAQPQVADSIRAAVGGERLELAAGVGTDSGALRAS